MTTTTSLLKVIVQLADKLCEPYFYANTPAAKNSEEENIMFCAAGNGLINCPEEKPQTTTNRAPLRHSCHFVQVTPYNEVHYGQRKI